MTTVAEAGQMRGDPKLTDKATGQYELYVRGCFAGTGGDKSGTSGMGTSCFSFDQWKDKQGYGTDADGLIFVR